MFKVRKLSEAQISISSELCRALFQMLIHKVAEGVVRQRNTEQMNVDVEKPPEGQAKNRHIGA